MFPFKFSTLLLALTSSFWTVASALPSPGNATSLVGPELSNELFQRAIAAPYVLTAFTSASESNLYVYTSNDGTTFSLLKGPAYTPPSGLIRDPSVIKHTEYVQTFVIDLLSLTCLARAAANITSSVSIRLSVTRSWRLSNALCRHHELDRHELCHRCEPQLLDSPHR